jgi:hypothetical protein
MIWGLRLMIVTVGLPSRSLQSRRSWRLADVRGWNNNLHTDAAVARGLWCESTPYNTQRYHGAQVRSRLNLIVGPG